MNERPQGTVDPAALSSTAPTASHEPEKRKCLKCGETKVISPETWPYRKNRRDRKGEYEANGARCLECERKRKAEYENRRDKIKASIKSVVEASVPATGKTDEQRTALTKANRLDVASALKAGSRVLNEYAPSVMARILEYLEDTDSPHHLWALELLAQRILPRKLYEELGGQAAGAGSIGDRRPTYIINVLPAQSPALGHVRIIDGEALPQPQEREDEPA